jgi:tRNA nucleotidyltransferase (CCA-adding enzyme)
MPDTRDVSSHVLRPPEAVLEISNTLERQGFDTWCVGGAVRDALLGLPNSDWDIATTATPGEVRQLFRRTVPVGEAHGTIGVLDRANVMHEVTTFRRDVTTDGRHAEVVFGASLDEDLARRDFTINAIAYKPSTGVLHDPFGGRADLTRGMIRAVGDPEARMREDRLRALRGIRFAARFDFEIDPATWQAIVSSAAQLTRLSAERVSQEIEKTMEQVRRPARALRLWKESGALATLVPALAGIDDITVGSLDCLPVPSGQRADQRKWNRVSALFFGLGEKQAYAAAMALRFSTARAKWIAHLAESWERIGPVLPRGAMDATRASVTPADVDVRRWVSIVGRTQFADFWRIVAARWAAERASPRVDWLAPNSLFQSPPPAATVRSLHRRGLRIAYGNVPLEVGDLALDGNDLIQMGIPKGPKIREILNTMLDAVLSDPSVNTPERLRELIGAGRGG